MPTVYGENNKIPKGTMCSINGDIIFTILPNGQLGLYMMTDPNKEDGIVFGFDDERWIEIIDEVKRALETKKNKGD